MHRYKITQEFYIFSSVLIIIYLYYSVSWKILDKLFINVFVPYRYQ